MNGIQSLHSAFRLRQHSKSFRLYTIKLLYSRSRIIFKNRSHAVSYSAISSAEASGSTSSYGGNSEFDSSEFAVRYTDDQETEERLDVDETDIV